MRKYLLTILFFILICAWASLARGESNKLPETMVGQSFVEQTDLRGSSITYYGGFTGNEAILNYNSDTMLGFGFPSLTGCFNASDLWDGQICHLLEYNGKSDAYGANLGLANLHSKTWVDDKVVLQTAALFKKSKLIVGDAYSGSDFLSNFAFWGRNLAQTGSSTDPSSSAAWRIKGYVLSDQAQAKWGGEEFEKNRSKIMNISEEALPIDKSLIISGSPIYLQNKNINLPTGTDSAFPEGKIWRVSFNGNIIINNDVRFQGKGTVIFDGNGEVRLKSGENIIPENSSDTSSKLGLIFINGARLELEGSNKVQAAIYVDDQAISIVRNAKNIDLIGSFVAKDFTGMDSAANIRFFYDYRLSRDWPPGFRYLNMPAAAEK